LFNERGLYEPGDKKIFFPDWVAGMFMMFRAKTFEEIRGFDPKYFMYYEDVDLCKRLRTHAKRAAVLSKVEVVHEARRASHRNWRLAFSHVNSAMRYLLTIRKH
jgi:N-acetylglucosaminyl-diphospho-decaprenol L-rhamnosyltransferase